MDKKVRKAVRSFLIENNNIVAIKYKGNKNKNYYDIPEAKLKRMKALLLPQLENLKKKPV